MSAPHVDVSVVLPVFNEAGHLEQEIARIREALEVSSFSFEIIAVDDGSSDGSTELLRTIEGIRLIELGRNRGAGTARRVGSRAAAGRVVVWTDCDMSYPNHEIPQLVKSLEGHDQVIGARKSEEGTKKALRVPAKWTIRRLAEFLSEHEIPDLNSGFRAFRREVLAQFLHLLPKGFSCVTTMTMAFMANGYSVHFIPIEYEKRAGTSKFHWYSDTKKYALQVVRLVLSYEPLRVFMPVGLAMLFFGIGKLAYDWTVRDFHLATNTLLILFAALQVLAIGLLADLVVRATRPRDPIDPA
jgi:polyisoprenyl-phosphate glycosyltransferase